MSKILNEQKKKTRDLMVTLANDLQDTLIAPDVQVTETLRDQEKILHYLTMQMVAEATPHGTEYNMYHNKDRLSLALRAQNQFCRTVMAMDYLDKKATVENELNNP